MKKKEGHLLRPLSAVRVRVRIHPAISEALSQRGEVARRTRHAVSLRERPVSSLMVDQGPSPRIFPHGLRQCEMGPSTGEEHQPKQSTTPVYSGRNGGWKRLTLGGHQTMTPGSPRRCAPRDDMRARGALVGLPRLPLPVAPIGFTMRGPEVRAGAGNGSQ